METRKNDPSTTQEGQHEPVSRDSEALQGSNHTTNSEEVRPPLPPRPETIDLLNDGNTFRTSTTRPNLQSHATTALSLTEITGQTVEPNDNFVSSIGRNLLGRGLRAKASLSQLNSARGSETGDTASVVSLAPNAEEGQEENLFGEFAAENDAQAYGADVEVLGLDEYPQDGSEYDFLEEFEHIGELSEDGQNEGEQLVRNLLVRLC